MLRSASAVMVNEGLAAPALPGSKAPSITYRPGWPMTRPQASVALPITAPPSGCAVQFSPVTPAMIPGKPGTVPVAAAILSFTVLAAATLSRLPFCGQFSTTRSVAGL
ncbi:hypothetical protein JOS77_12545 [Chromobacterium haemolyticum]|nr:hypothetical protein JOS77_12545 [Chromobacterium haemolyticum]